jgi:nitrate/nitrite transporter NarK
MVLFLYNFVFVGMETTLPLLLDKNYGITSKWLGIIFTGVGVVVIFVNAFVHPLGKKIGEKVNFSMKFLRKKTSLSLYLDSF